MKKLLLLVTAVACIVMLIAGVFVIVKRRGNDTSQQYHTQKRSEEVYFSDKSGSVGNGIPHKTIASIPELPNFGISWVQESVVDGNDTCTLFDATTKQVYATISTSSGDNPTGTIDTTKDYYANTKIAERAAYDLLSNSCYKI